MMGQLREAQTLSPSDVPGDHSCQNPPPSSASSQDKHASFGCALSHPSL